MIEIRQELLASMLAGAKAEFEKMEAEQAKWEILKKALIEKNRLDELLQKEAKEKQITDEPSCTVGERVFLDAVGDYLEDFFMGDK